MHLRRLGICLLAVLPLFASQDALAGAGSYTIEATIGTRFPWIDKINARKS